MPEDRQEDDATKSEGPRTVYTRRNKDGNFVYLVKDPSGTLSYLEPKDEQHLLDSLETSSQMATFDEAAGNPAESLDGATPLETFEELQRQDFKQDIDLKARYADAILKMLAGQVLIANLIFAVYLYLNNSPESEVMVAWLASVVVEVIGVAVIVTKYLFSEPRDK